MGTMHRHQFLPSSRADHIILKIQYTVLYSDKPISEYPQEVPWRRQDIHLDMGKTNYYMFSPRNVAIFAALLEPLFSY